MKKDLLTFPGKLNLALTFTTSVFEMLFVSTAAAAAVAPVNVDLIVKSRSGAAPGLST